jgi:hypothetical protein
VKTAGNAKEINISTIVAGLFGIEKNNEQDTATNTVSISRVLRPN